MFKPSQQMMARLRLTTKQVNGGYYKGNRTGSMGYFDHKGNYVIDWKKVRTYVVPEDLATFKLTPFVTKRMDPTPSAYRKQVERNGRTYSVLDSLKGPDFLDQWYSSNPNEVLARETAEQETADELKTPKQ